MFDASCITFKPSVIAKNYKIVSAEFKSSNKEELIINVLLNYTSDIIYGEMSTDTNTPKAFQN